jgi:hypothetical protein
MKLTKVVLLAVLVIGLFAWMGLADTPSSPPDFTIGFGYTIEENSAPSFEGADAAGACAGPLTGATTVGTAHLTSNGDWTIRTNGDFTVTLSVTIPQGVNTGYKLGGYWNPGFDAYNGDGSTIPMEHIDAEDQQFFHDTASPLTHSWRATTAQDGAYSSRNTFISTLILNMGINREGLLDPADTYQTTVTITVSES